jgi:flavin-dependent dehydrogenase
MPRDFLKGVRDEYDTIVIGSGLAGLTAANTLARNGRSVLLLEQHYKLGGMATWFPAPGGHIDISLHGFRSGWSKAVGRHRTRDRRRIVQLKNVRFDTRCSSFRQY